MIWKSYSLLVQKTLESLHSLGCSQTRRLKGLSHFSNVRVETHHDSAGKIAMIECDVGQSEFTPPGFVSLSVLDSPILGPPFTHLDVSESTKSIFLGCTSAWKDPDRYTAAIFNLFKHYTENIRSDGIPLIVNTPGWVKGMGYDILLHMISELSPSQIVCLQAEPPGLAGTLSYALSAVLTEDPKSLHTIECVSEP